MNDSFSFYLDDFFVELMPLASGGSKYMYFMVFIAPKKKKKKFIPAK